MEEVGGGSEISEGFGTDGNVFPHSGIERSSWDHPVSNLDAVPNQPLKIHVN